MILMKKLLLIIVILIGFCSIKVHAQVNDSIRISLLTCAPGTEIYSLFGHTAIRVEVPSRRIDLVYNYGMFSFRTPNFIYRFVKGETDYQLGIVPYSYFEMEYAERGSYVVQQELNLSQKEKERLIAILEENYLPQNRTYRYNYFYDNCTTRARDKIEESIEGKVIYQVSREPLTFREIVYRFTKDFPWSEFGIDLCLGSEADKAIDLRAQMFSPFVTMHAMDSAVIRTFDGSSHPLVKQSSRIVDPVPHPHEKEFPLSPMTCALILLALSLCISLLELRYKFATWWFDLILFGAQGIAGCVIAFLFFFSVHPTVGSNYLLIILNPIPLVYLPCMLYKALKHRKDIYHIGNITVLTLFIVFWWLIPQKITLVILPLALSLLIRSIARIIVTRKRLS